MKKAFLISIIAIASTAAAHANPIDLGKGEIHYKTLCVSCHGDKGHGDGIAGKTLTETPANIYEGLTSWFETERDLIDTVLNGSEEMPAWKSVLNESDVKDIFAYIEKVNQ